MRRLLSGYTLLNVFYCGILSIAMFACNSSDSNDDPNDTAIASIEMIPDDEPVISLSQTVQLKALTFNSDGDEVSGANLVWTSSNENILSVTNSGLMTGEQVGTSTISVEAESRNVSTDFTVVDLSGTWVGGEAPDTLSYTLVQSGTSVEGTFQSKIGFPPITNVNTGNLTGSLNFDRYNHILELTTEDACVLQISGPHFVELQNDGEIILKPGTGTLGSSNCSISGTIDFTTLRRQ